MTPALLCRDIEAGYGDRDALRGVSFTVDENEMVGIIGPNGAGKTTLVRAITGLVKPRRGEVQLFGQDATTMPAGERARLVGVVPQGLETPMAFTVEEIVSMGRLATASRWHGPSPEDRKAIERAMAYTDVVDLRTRPFMELSGGERQRAVIAMALAQTPRLIIMDEPTSYLDLKHSLVIMQIVERLNREHGVAVLMVSHDLNMAAEFCSRLIMLDGGRIVTQGPPRETLRPDVLRKVYGCDVHVQANPASGSVMVMPRPRLVAGEPGRGVHVHVVGGGGSAEDLLRRLTLGASTITCGVLNRGDTDAQTAAALDIPTVVDEPFCPVTDERVTEALEMSLPADAVVVCGVPFGPGNLANLRIAEAAAERGATVLVVAGTAERDHTRDGAATDRVAALVAAGAIEVADTTGVAALLPVRLDPGPSLKRRFPFRVGTTSYVVPADVLPNVSALADRIDDVELLVFESDEISNLPGEGVVRSLADIAASNDLTYTVHLPVDIRLGSADEEERRRSVEKCLRVVERMAALDPFAYIVHFSNTSLVPMDALEAHEWPRWRARLDRSVSELVAGGIAPERLCVETLSYDFGHVAPLVEEHDLSICLDIGHLLLKGQLPDTYLDRYLPRTRVLHVHGIHDGKDHASLRYLDETVLADLVERLSAEGQPRRVLTMEVFGQEDFITSCEVLAGSWRGHGYDAGGGERETAE